MINKKSGLIIHPEVSNIFKQILDKEPDFSAVSKLWEFTKFDDRETYDFVVWHEPYSQANIVTWRENIKKNNQSKPQISKVGRAIKDIFDRNGQPISEADVEKMVNYWKSLSDPSDIEIVKGEEIKFWYLRENYAYPGAPVRPNPSNNITGNSPRRTHTPYHPLEWIEPVPRVSIPDEERMVQDQPEMDLFGNDVVNVTQRLTDSQIAQLRALHGNVGDDNLEDDNLEIGEIPTGGISVTVTTPSYLGNIYRTPSSSPRQTFTASDRGTGEAPRQEEYIVKGSLSKSCMRYPDCSNLLNIYSDSPDISLMITKDENGKLLSRALVWKLDNGRMVMDRVYYSDESHITKYERYAQSKGWDYALTKYFPGERRWSVNGKVVGESDANFVFRPMKEYENWPYIDTFCYMDWETGYLMSSRRGIKTKTCLEMHDIRGNSKLVSTKMMGSFTQREVDWMLQHSDFKILFKEGGIGKISKESKEELLRKSYEEGWEMTAILCPSDWEWEEWFNYVMKACDRGCVVGTLRLKSQFTNEQWNKFINEPRVKAVRYYMSLVNVPLEFAQVMIKENGWDNRYIDLNPVLLDLPDDMALDYMDALKRVHPTNVILSAHKSIQMNARAEYLLSMKRKMDMFDVDWMTMIFSENVRNGIGIDKNWILRMSEEDRVLVSMNAYKKYSIDIFQHMEVSPYKDIRAKYEKSMDLSNMKDILNSTKVSMSSSKKARKNTDTIGERWSADGVTVENSTKKSVVECTLRSFTEPKKVSEISPLDNRSSNDEGWD